IFAALSRRETFGTSGTRIRLRLFGGWGLPTETPGDEAAFTRASQRAVPMGSDLPPAGDARAPTFLLFALKAPDGAALDRAQIVKVWLDGDLPREQIVDVATGSTDQGASQLVAGWTDPDFDPRQRAVYYLRVLEVETPRWTTLLADRHGLPRPKGSAAMIRERAWSSPIWYTPVATAR
ncbi:MAG: DUF3604 domain-containing protein, partial [Gammaproteobacteria bacterium]